MICPNRKCQSDDLADVDGTMLWCSTCGAVSYPNGSAHYVPAQAKSHKALREALKGCNELFGNYGFADESPCARDKEIVANMIAALDAAQK